MDRNREPLALLFLAAAAVILSAVRPYDGTTWWLEAFPVLLGALILAATARRFPLTPLVYRLLFLHALILILGAHYTYARVPLGFWVQDLLDLSRNHYDRLGHLAQGFIPAILTRGNPAPPLDAGIGQVALLLGDLCLPRLQRLL